MVKRGLHLCTARRSNQSILKEISPEYSLEGLMLKLKLQYLDSVKNWVIGKDPDAGKDWRRQEEKGTTEDEMVGWHHWLDGLEFEQALGVSDGQGRLACCNSWCCKESDATEWLNWNDIYVHERCHPGSDYLCGQARAWQLSLEQCQEWLQVGGRKRGLKTQWPWFRQTLWGKLPNH